MIVPRSSTFVDSDDEFALYAVTTFKKHSPEFVHGCREHKWTPRDFKYKQGGKEDEQKEIDRVAADEKKLWGEALRLGRTGWSEGAMVWIHVLALRVFVETVLRYGLPLDFVCGLVKVRFQLKSSLTFPPCTSHHNRQPKRPRRKRATALTRTTHTSPGTPSAVIRKVESRKTTHKCHLKWQLQDRGMIPSILLTSATTLNLTRLVFLLLFRRVSQPSLMTQCLSISIN